MKRVKETTKFLAEKVERKEEEGGGGKEGMKE